MYYWLQPPLYSYLLYYRGYVVSPFGQDGFAILQAHKILESLKSNKAKSSKGASTTAGTGIGASSSIAVM